MRKHDKGHVPEPEDKGGIGDEPGSGLVFNPHSVIIHEHRHGYREFRCVPASCYYGAKLPLKELLSEFYSQRVATDPQGLGLMPEFWSGSDAALRLQSIPQQDLLHRELAAIGSRRSLGINAPDLWVSQAEIKPFVDDWNSKATDVHFSKVPSEADKTLWAHYGMGPSYAEAVITGFNMRKSLRQPLGQDRPTVNSAAGTWYSWSTISEWNRWPRRQDAETLSTRVGSSKLPLFVSHRWESDEHPDPGNSQLAGLKTGLTLALAAAVLQKVGEEEATRTESGLPEIIAEHIEAVLETDALIELKPWALQVRTTAEQATDESAFGDRLGQLDDTAIDPVIRQIQASILVWYDYSSMLQEPRTQKEEQSFQQEILTLNEIQAQAVTLVIAGDSQYLSRAWCFLELCGGMRQCIVELTPTWGESINVGDSVTRWASRSDQLIGALHLVGPEAIRHSGLESKQPEDLPSIATLLGKLPLTGIIESDDSDLIGGAIPLPFQEGAWKLPEGSRNHNHDYELSLALSPEFGDLPGQEALQLAAEQLAETETLEGKVGIWVYTTQRVLTLAWASKAESYWKLIQGKLASLQELDPFVNAIQSSKTPPVSCLWADCRSLADDGFGWTRAITSDIEVLVIVTQTDLPQLCWIYDWVVRAHVASGVLTVTYSPETGRTLVYLPNQKFDFHAVPRMADVMAVHRFRRPDARVNRMFLSPHIQPEDVEVLSALRLDPSQGIVPPGEVIGEAAEAGYGNEGDKITAADLIKYSRLRVETEALARSETASWDTWCEPRLHQSAWQVGFAPLQLDIFRQLIDKVCTVIEHPMERRKLLYILVEDHEGYALPPGILDDADEIIRRILDEQKTPKDNDATGG